MEQPGSSTPITPFSDRASGAIRIESAGAQATRFETDGSVAPLQTSFAARAVKRGMDLVGAGVALIILTPFLIALVLILTIESHGHPLFIQERLGRSGVPFRIFKFRTMSCEQDGPLQAQLDRDSQLAHEWATFRKLRNDPRITPIGRILRKYSLDELPQFLNVFLGHMSLVGPRPIITEEASMFGPYLASVLSVRPGLTGLWGISGRNDLGYEERVQLEDGYVQRWTLGLDISILLKTIPKVVNGRGAY